MRRDVEMKSECDKFGFCHDKYPRDVLGGFDKVSMSPVISCNDKLARPMSPEAEASAWLRDEPADALASGDEGGAPTKTGTAGEEAFFPFVTATHSALPECTGSGGGTMLGNKAAGSPCDLVPDGSSWSPLMGAADVPTVATPSTSAAQTQDRFEAWSARVLAELKGTKVKESVIREAVQRYGGGQKGFRAVIKAIMIWIAARTRHKSESGDFFPSQPLSSTTSTVDNVDKFPWVTTSEAGITVDSQSDVLGNADQASLVDVNYMADPVPLCQDDHGGRLRNLRASGLGSTGELVEVSNFDAQQSQGAAVPLGFTGSCGFGSEDTGGGSPLADGQDIFPSLSSGNWALYMGDKCVAQDHENGAGERMIRKRSLSPAEHNGLPFGKDFTAYDDSHSHDSKIRGHSRRASSGFPSLRSWPEDLAYGNAASPQSVSDVPVTAGTSGAMSANPFAPGGPFSLSSSNPSAVDATSDFASPFGMQGSILFDEMMGLAGSAAHGGGSLAKGGGLGCLPSRDSFNDRQSPAGHVGETAKAVGIPAAAACTRLARKNRMHRNRRSSLSQANRFGAETILPHSGKAGGTSSSGGALRTTSQSPKASPPSRGLQSDSQDRRNHLQFLLQKVLRPSDVGNLGRVVLPKKDAESHLPWLGAREGVQFACEDYDTGDMMTLRYRYWPNNKSRMYILENTGEFVRKHKLQESDRLLIYRHLKNASYVIRARKAGECVAGSPSAAQKEETEGEVKKSKEQTSRSCSSCTTSHEQVKESSECGVSSTSKDESVAADVGDGSSHGTFLTFAEFQEAAKTDTLVRFPSLESFDVELLDLGPGLGECERFAPSSLQVDTDGAQQSVPDGAERIAMDASKSTADDAVV